MIVSTIVLVGLLVSSASGSAIKGRVEEYRGTKSAAPVDYRRDQYEQRTVAYAAKGVVAAPPATEQTKLADSEFYQQREEAKQQFYEAQPQLRETDCKSDLCRKPAAQFASKTEERAEEQTKLVQAPEQVKYDDYPQQREEAVQQVKQEVKGLKQEPQRTVAYEAAKTYDKYEARPQVREEVPSAAAAPVPVAPVVVPEVRASRVESSAGYSKTSDERHEEQVQYTAQVLEDQRYESQREEARSAGVKSPPTSVVAQRTEFVQQERQQEEALQQQAVELTRQQEYNEQRRYEEHSEQRPEEQQQQQQQFSAQVREDQVKGGLRPAGAEAEPYAFDYSVEGSTRREQGDKDGVVRGQYTLSNPDGTQRIVDYVADQDGFRAQVRTNEFGTEGQQAVAVPAPVRSAPVYEGKTRYQQEQVAVAAAPAVKSAPAPVVQVAELVRTGSYKEATKGFAPEQAPQQPQQIEIKAPPAPVLAHEPEPFKGQRSEEPVVQAAATREPIKSAELRTPKAIGASYSSPKSIVVTRASGFESATAHRVVHPQPVSVAVPVSVPVPVRHQPVVSVVRHQVVSPVRGYQSGPQHHHHHHQAYPYRQYHHVPAPVVVGVPSSVSRSQLQHDRYPPASYRRDHLANPRVSFYSNRDIEDEQPVGFEHPIGQI